MEEVVFMEGPNVNKESVSAVQNNEQDQALAEFIREEVESGKLTLESAPWETALAGVESRETTAGQ